MTFKAILPAITLLTFSATFIAAADDLDFTGTWDSKTTMENGDVTEAQIIVAQDGDALTGVVVRKDEETKLKTLTSEGKQVTLSLEFDYQGTDILFAVKAEGTSTSLTGTWTASDRSGTQLATGPWTASKAEKPISLAGAWDAVATTNDGNELKSVAHFEGEGDSLSGELKSSDTTQKLTDLKLDGKKLQFDMIFPYEGTDIDIRIKTELKGEDDLVGTWIAFGSDGSEAATGPWKAKRASTKLELVGEWAAVASMGDGSEVESTYHFSDKDGKLIGHSASDRGTVDFDTVTLKDNKLTVDLELPYEGNTIDVRISAESKDDLNKLAGKWVVFDDVGEEAATGDWAAKRKAAN